MIITDDFVLLNFPKTGSSFARKAIKRIYGARESAPLEGYVELSLPNIRNSAACGQKDYHGTYSQIPLEYKARPIISIIRSPVDRILSMYYCRAWVRIPPIPFVEVKQTFPRFPNLSIDEFLDLQDMSFSYRLGTVGHNSFIGIQSVQFLGMFSKDPQQAIQEALRNHNSHTLVKWYLENIRFLPLDHLRESLFNYLVLFGHSEKQLQHILSDEPSNASIYPVNVPKEKLITPKVISYIESKEWLYSYIYNSVMLQYP